MDSEAPPQDPDTPPPAPKPNKVGNAIVLVILVVLAVVGAYFMLQPPSQVTIGESHEVSGRLIVEGTVLPPMNAVNLEMRALQLRGTPLSFFQIRDDSGQLDVYVDPANAQVPAEGARVSVHGRRIEASGGDMSRTRPFVADEVHVLD